MPCEHARGHGSTVGGMKSMLVLLVVIAAAGWVVYHFVVEDKNCVESPVTGQCVDTTTGYGPTVGGGGGNSGGGGQPVEIEIDIP